MFAGKPYWPGPWEAPSVIVPYFQTHGAAVTACLFLQIGATICLGLFTAVVVSRLHFLGVRAAGPWIALFGGFLTVLNGFSAGMMLWTMLRPAIVHDSGLLLVLYYYSYALGGPGFSMPMGLLIAGVSISGGIAGLLPRWIVVLGIVLAIAGELSWLHMIFPGALFLIPLTRFPGFIWIIAVGFALPRSRGATLSAAAA